MSQKKWLVFICIVVIHLALHWRHFNKELMSMHVWRQTQTQTTIINFYEEDFNILNPKQNNRGAGDGLFRMEFPLMQWLIACLYKVFGNHLVITRIFMFITSLLTILGVYRLLKSIFKIENLALLGAWTFSFSPAFFYFMINPIPDVFALGAGIWGLAFFFNWTSSKKKSTLIMGGLLLAIATLSKLPFIIYYTVPFTYFLIQLRHNKRITKENVIDVLSVFAFILFPLAWYGTVIPTWGGNGIRKGIMDNHITFYTLLEYLIHNFISALPELMLNYGSVPFFIASFFYLFKKRIHKHKYFIIYLILGCTTLLYFFFEINMIAKVHEYYLFPFYPALFMLVSYGAYHLINSKVLLLKYFSFIALLSLPVITHLRFARCWDENNPLFNKDLLIYKNELRNAVPKDALCVAGNDVSTFIMLYYIDKKGWCFSNSNPNLQQMITQGAEYLYLDTSNLDSNTNIRPYCEKLLLQRGSIEVFKLKKE